MTAVPAAPKIYHIVHVDRLPSILSAGGLRCDAVMRKRSDAGTAIGMQHIKQRRLQNELHCHADLMVGDCVPFYFCPRSPMLYLLHMGNSEDLTYQGGQQPIIHLEVDLVTTVDWAERNDLRWAFTLSNAGAAYFEAHCHLEHLGKIDWAAVQARDWRSHREGKQAEFLVEKHFSWRLVERIGVHSQAVYQQVTNMIHAATHKPSISVRSDWYYSNERGLR